MGNVAFIIFKMRLRVHWYRDPAFSVKQPHRSLGETDAAVTCLPSLCHWRTPLSTHVCVSTRQVDISLDPTMEACVKCNDPLLVQIESDAEDEDASAKPSAEDGRTVPDSVELRCGCHFHWCVCPRRQGHCVGTSVAYNHRGVGNAFSMNTR